jgi:hypothetical protein
VTIRPHGRAKYVVEKCRCDVCRTAANVYERNRYRQRAYGRAAYVDAAPGREHVRTLQAAGMGWKRIAESAGLGNSVVWKLLYGDPTRNMGPSKRIRPDTERKILAVTLNLADGANVDATGTHRRLKALVALGYSQNRLAEQLGMTRGNFGKMMGYSRVTAGTATAVRELYDRWSLLPAKKLSPRDTGVVRSRNYAKAHGWAPPLAWDDDTIDDPTAEPEGVVLRAVLRTKLPQVDELKFLLDAGESRAAIAARFGVREGSVEQALMRDSRKAVA